MRADHKAQLIDGQYDFNGGLEMSVKPVGNQYRYADNIITRFGDARTRGGMRMAFPVLRDGFNDGFWFNEGNQRFNDGTHTGFWFPFVFASFDILDVQGVGFFRFQSDLTFRQIVVTRGRIYVYDNGLLEEVAAVDDIGADEEIIFEMANDLLIMFRSGDNRPLQWDGSDTGFVAFGESAADPIVNAPNGTYMFGRLWLTKGDDVYASDILDFNTYDYVNQLFSVRKGDGDDLVQLLPFHDSFAVAFKKRSVSLLSGVNTQVGIDQSTPYTGLAAAVSVTTISNDVGMVGPKAYAIHGEQISFMSYKGVTSLSRSRENTVSGRETSLSAPIQPIIDRINWSHPTASEGVCGVFFDDYLLFGVPLDGAETNNAILVYDTRANGGRGAWVSVWTGKLVNPEEFFVADEKLYFLGTDGVMREMFKDSPWDSENVQDDTPRYDPSKKYAVGDLVYNELDTSTENIFRCIKAHGPAPDEHYVSDTDYWEDVADVSPEALYPVVSKVWTRYYDHRDESTPKKWNRCQILFDHQRPKVTVAIRAEDDNTDKAIFTDVEYDYLEYDIANTADWVPDNSNLDFNEPHRKDYPWYIPQDGFYMDADDGIYISIYEHHSLRFIPRLLNNNAFSIMITNNQGSMRLKSIVAQAQESFFAKRDR